MARRPSIEAKGKLVEVVVQMRVTDRAVVGPEQPALEQRHHPVYAREARGGEIVMPAQQGDPMRIAVPGSGRSRASRPCARRSRVRWCPAMKACRLATDASGTRRIRIRPIPRPTASAATTTRALVAVDRPCAPPRPPRSSHRPRRGRPAIAARAYHRAAQLVQPGPRRLIAPQAQDALESQRAGAGLWLVTHHIARNHVVSGVRVSWKIVPAVTDVCRPHAAHSSRLRTGHALGWPHCGQRNPCGHRCCIRYARHAASVAKRASNSASVRGYSSTAPYTTCWGHLSQVDSQNRCVEYAAGTLGCQLPDSRSW